MLATRARVAVGAATATRSIAGAGAVRIITGGTARRQQRLHEAGAAAARLNGVAAVHTAALRATRMTPSGAGASNAFGAGRSRVNAPAPTAAAPAVDTHTPGAASYVPPTYTPATGAAAAAAAAAVAASTAAAAAPAAASPAAHSAAPSAAPSAASSSAKSADAAAAAAAAAAEADLSDGEGAAEGGAADDVLEVELSDLNPDGTLKDHAVADAAAAGAAGAAGAAAVGAGVGAAAAALPLSSEAIREAFRAKVRWLRAHNYHHQRLSGWIGNWTTDQNEIMRFRKAQIEYSALRHAWTPRSVVVLRLMLAFKHFDLWARLNLGHLHKEHDKHLVRRVLFCIHRQSMCEQLFDAQWYGIPNDYQGRLIVRALHLWVVQHKLKVSARLREGPKKGETLEAFEMRDDKHRKAYIKLLFDKWWGSVRKSQQAHGTPMMLQDKTAKQSQKKVFAVMLMLDSCMKLREDGDPTAEQKLMGVLWRNVYGGQCHNKAQLRALAQYLIDNLAHYTQLSEDDAYCGNLTWAKFPAEPITRTHPYEPVQPHEFDHTLMERGEFIDFSPDYKR